MVQTENLRDFSMKVSKTLNVKEILGALIQVIQKTVGSRRYIFVSPMKMKIFGCFTAQAN